MKNFIYLAILLVAATSCKSIKYSSTNKADVNSLIVNVVTADLTVSDKKVTVTLPKSNIVKRNIQLSKEGAIAKALRESKADVLVEPVFDVTYKKRLLGLRIQNITVSGYPANYTNFRSENSLIKELGIPVVLQKSFHMEGAVRVAN